MTDKDNHYHECAGCGDIQDKDAHIPGDAATEESAQTCTICGYEYEGENLPDGFTCPLCKHPASDFEKVIR